MKEGEARKERDREVSERPRKREREETHSEPGYFRGGRVSLLLHLGLRRGVGRIELHELVQALLGLLSRLDIDSQLLQLVLQYLGLGRGEE